MKLHKGYCHVIPVLIAFVILSGLLLTYKRWETFERKAYDFRFWLTERLNMGRSQPSNKTVVVGIEERLVLQEKPLLFLYPDIGKFLKKMRDYNVAVIGIDLIPVHKQSEKLKNAVSSMNVDKKYVEFSEEIGERLDKSLLEPIMQVSESIPIVQVYHGELVPYYYGVAPFIKNLYLADAVFTDGYTSNNDGVIRRQTLKPNGKDTLASAIYNLLTGKEYRLDMVRLNYALAKNIPFYSFTDIMNGKVDSDRLSGKAIILGYLSGYEDVYSTPLNRAIRPSWVDKNAHQTNQPGDRRLPGPLIHGIIIETLITNTPLKEVPFLLQVFALITLIAIGLILSAGLRPYNAIAGVFIITAGFFIVNVILFSLGYIIHMLPHLLSPLLTLTFVYPYRYLVEERSRKKIYRMFSYYIDEEVLDSLLKKDPMSLLRGEHKDVCILFLDIRDFTRLSTQNKAENVVGFLNLYFGKITDIIQGHKGFVNKFIGDGVLAFFATGENPVANALLASQEIIRETERFNNEGTVRHLISDWTLNIGIGVHYGRVVMGNIGSEKKMDFTIIGEHVNIASRIEGLTKHVERRLLLSNEAYMMVKGQFSIDYLGEFSVKGLDKPVAIYTIEEGERG
jgi:class 3 adenylate cyclase